MRYLFIPMVIGLMVFVACVNTTDTDDGVPHDQNTVLGTLLLFEDVWNSCDIYTYKGLLKEGDFTFYFDPMDVEYGDLPESWGYEDEIAAVGNLFDALGAENVDVTLDLSEVTEPEEGADTYKIENIPYEVLVHIEEEDWILPANAHLDMELEKVDGEWIITDWWDRVSGRLPGISECTWGEIKALYYH